MTKVHRVIRFNQKAWLKPYIDMNTMLRQKAKNNFEGFSKNYEIVRKGRNIKLVTTERKRNYLVSEQNHHTTKFFTENVLAVEMKKKLKY